MFHCHVSFLGGYSSLCFCGTTSHSFPFPCFVSGPPRCKMFLEGTVGRYRIESHMNWSWQENSAAYIDRERKLLLRIHGIGLFTMFFFYHKHQLNVGTFTIHGSYNICKKGFKKVRSLFCEMIILRLGNPNDLHMYLRTPWRGKTIMTYKALWLDRWPSPN